MPKKLWKLKDGKIYHGTDIVDNSKVCELINSLENLIKCLKIEEHNYLIQMENFLYRNKDGVIKENNNFDALYRQTRWLLDCWEKINLNEYEKEIIGGW